MLTFDFKIFFFFFPEIETGEDLLNERYRKPVSCYFSAGDGCGFIFDVQRNSVMSIA